MAELLLDAIGFLPADRGATTPAAGAPKDDLSQSGADGIVPALPLTPPSTVSDRELRQLCARAVLEARCGRLWLARRPVVIDGAHGWLESVVLGEDGLPLERGEALRLPWHKARRHVHAAVLVDMRLQAPVRCFWRGLPDLAKGLKLGAATAILAEIERGPAQAV